MRIDLVRSLASAALALTVVSSGIACTKASAPRKPAGLGKSLAQTAARSLVATPDGKTLAFVADVEPPPEATAPEGVLQGVLTTVTTDGGVPRQLGGGVSTLDDGFRLSPDGRWIAYLQGFRFRDQAGTLQIAPMPTGEARQLAASTTYYRFSSDSRYLGYVASGELHLVSLASGEDHLVAQQVVTFELSADSAYLMARRPIAAGGELLLVAVGSEEKPRKLGERVGDYGFSQDGKALAFTARVGGPNEPYSLFVGSPSSVPAKAGEKAGLFAFSPDGAWIAFIGNQEPGKPQGDLNLLPVVGGQPINVGQNVADFRWSPGARAVVLRESHEDKTGRTWSELKVATLPKGAIRLKEHAAKDSFINYLWSPDGSRLAYLKRVGTEITLNLLSIEGEGPARVVSPWVFTYQFSANGSELWYRANCVDDGQMCELFSVSVDNLERPATKLGAGIPAFKTSADGKRLLLVYPRTDTKAASDLGLIELGVSQPSRGVDRYALPGAIFLDTAGKRIAYLVGERKREGVYVAEVPDAPSTPQPR